MAISRQVTEQNLHLASGSPTITFPGTWTPAENDLVLLFCHTTNTTALNAVPAGWTDAGGGLIEPGDTTEYVAAVWHFVTSGEAAAVTRTYTVTGLWVGSETNMVFGAVYRGVDTVDPVADFGTASNAGNTTAHTLPAIAGTNLVADGVVAASVSADGAATYTNPAGWTQLQLQTAADPGAYLGERIATTSAGVAVPATTITCSLSGEYVSYAVALRPATSSATDLVVADAGVGTTIDAPALTQGHVLAVADGTVAATIETPTLTQVHQLAVADLTADTNIDDVTLDVGAVVLVVADLTVASSVDGPSLTQAHHLAVADLNVDDAIDAVALTQVHVLTVADLAVSCVFDVVTLTTGDIAPVLTGPFTVVELTPTRTVTDLTPVRDVVDLTPTRTLEQTWP